jgi:hypothetical protein
MPRRRAAVVIAVQLVVQSEPGIERPRRCVIGRDLQASAFGVLIARPGGKRCDDPPR